LRLILVLIIFENYFENYLNAVLIVINKLKDEDNGNEED
jgi:hypothetical protein